MEYKGQIYIYIKQEPIPAEDENGCKFFLDFISWIVINMRLLKESDTDPYETASSNLIRWADQLSTFIGKEAAYELFQIDPVTQIPETGWDC